MHAAYYLQYGNRLEICLRGPCQVDYTLRPNRTFNFVSASFESKPTKRRKTPDISCHHEHPGAYLQSRQQSRVFPGRASETVWLQDAVSTGSKDLRPTHKKHFLPEPSSPLLGLSHCHTITGACWPGSHEDSPGCQSAGSKGCAQQQQARFGWAPVRPSSPVPLQPPYLPGMKIGRQRAQSTRLTDARVRFVVLLVPRHLHYHFEICAGLQMLAGCRAEVARREAGSKCDCFGPLRFKYA